MGRKYSCDSLGLFHRKKSGGMGHKWPVKRVHTCFGVYSGITLHSYIRDYIKI